MPFLADYLVRRRLRMTSFRSTVPSVCGIVFALCSIAANCQNTSNDVPPVIDVHVHAMDESFPGGPMCPNTAKFLASDPSTKEATNGWSHEECTTKLYPAPQ